jgi:hypothetical protein
LSARFCAASLFTKNVLGDGFDIGTSETERLRMTRLSIVVVAVLALSWWLVARTSLVGLLLIGYSGVTQFMAKRPPALFVGAGIASGIVIVAAAGRDRRTDALRPQRRPLRATRKRDDRARGRRDRKARCTPPSCRNVG